MPTSFAGVSDIYTAVVESLKVLDPKRPIREADVRPIKLGRAMRADIVEKSLCTGGQKFSGPWARLSRRDSGDLIAQR